VRRQPQPQFHDAADTGKCLGGPCGGTPLVQLQVEERDGKVFFKGIDDG